MKYRRIKKDRVINLFLFALRKKYYTKSCIILWNSLIHQKSTCIIFLPINFKKLIQYFLYAYIVRNLIRDCLILTLSAFWYLSKIFDACFDKMFERYEMESFIIFIPSIAIGVYRICSGFRISRINTLTIYWRSRKKSPQVYAHFINLKFNYISR